MAEEDLFSYFKSEGVSHLTTYCIVEFQGDKKIFESGRVEGSGSTEHVHAEIKMIEWLKQSSTKLGESTVIIHQNKAPCATCAKDLIRLVQDHTDLKLRIKAVGTHYQNADELRNLMLTPGVTLTAFTQPDWDCLHQLTIGVPRRPASMNANELLKRDRNTARAFENIIGGNPQY